MLIYEVVNIINGYKITDLYFDRNQAIDEASRHALKDYDETIVYEYVEKDGKFYVTRSIMHIGTNDDEF